MANYIPWTISAVSLLVAIFTFLRNGNKDHKAEIREDDAVMAGIKESLLKANMKLDQVCSTTNETRTDIKAINKDVQALEIRVSVVERDLKTAFNRIDDLKD